MSLQCVWRQLRKESKDKMTKAIEDRIIRVIRNFFKEENFGAKTVLNAKIMVIEIKTPQPKNTSMKLNLT